MFGEKIMDQRFDVVVAGTVLSLKGDEEKLKALAAKLNEEVNAVLLADARVGKLEAALICAMNNLEAKCELEKRLCEKTK